MLSQKFFMLTADDNVDANFISQCDLTIIHILSFFKPIFFAKESEINLKFEVSKLIPSILQFY